MPLAGKRSRRLDLIESNDEMKSSSDSNSVNHPHGAVNNKVVHKKPAFELDPLIYKKRLLVYSRQRCQKLSSKAESYYDWNGYLSKEDAEKESKMPIYAIQTDHLWISHWQS